MEEGESYKYRSFMEEKWKQKWRLVFSKGKMVFAVVFLSLKISRISELEMGTTVKIWTEAWGLQESSRDNTFLQ